MTEKEQSSPETPAGCTVIIPPTDLKDKALVPGKDFGFDLEAIKRAEIALEELSVNFRDWIVTDAETLRQACQSVEQSAYSAESVDALFSAAHDLKGQACTLGYPIAGAICHSLCQLIDSLPEKQRIPPTLVKQHVDAVSAIVREEITNEDHPVARAVFKKLREVTLDYLSQELKRLGDQGAEDQNPPEAQQPKLPAAGAKS